MRARRGVRGRTLPPLPRLSGQSLNHDAKCLPLLNALRSEAGSAQRVSTVTSLMPGMVVKSTPKVRAINFPASLAGCPRFDAEGRGFGAPAVVAGCGAAAIAASFASSCVSTSSI